MKDSLCRYRLKKIIIAVLMAGVCGLAYLCFVLYTGYGIPCIFYKITGLQCPGCGISRMFVNIFRGNLKSAFESNQVIFILLVPAIIYSIISSYRYIVHGYSRKSRAEQLLLIAVVIVLVVFGIVRNADVILRLAHL